MIFENPALSALIVDRVRRAVGQRPIVAKIGATRSPRALHELASRLAPRLDGFVLVNGLERRVVKARPERRLRGRDARHRRRRRRRRVRARADAGGRARGMAQGGRLEPHDPRGGRHHHHGARARRPRRGRRWRHGRDGARSPTPYRRALSPGAPERVAEDIMATTTAAGIVKDVDPQTLSRLARRGPGPRRRRAPSRDVRRASGSPARCPCRCRRSAGRAFPTWAAESSSCSARWGSPRRRGRGRSCRTAGPREVYHLPGGLRAWKRAGLAVERSPGAGGLSLPRQVQIVAGSLVVLGVALGAAVSPWFLLLSAFIGAGLVFSGASGTCGMAACWRGCRTIAGT